MHPNDIKINHASQQWHLDIDRDNVALSASNRRMLTSQSKHMTNDQLIAKLQVMGVEYHTYADIPSMQDTIRGQAQILIRELEDRK